MAYALWNAFFLETLSDSLGDDEMAQASILCNKLTEFLLTARCLKWVEMAIILSYGGFTNLFDNVVRALHAAENATIIANPHNSGKSLPAFQYYSLSRKQLFTDYAYVISPTGTTPGEKEGTKKVNPIMQVGFQSRQ
jgi:hypothetical protein